MPQELEEMPLFPLNTVIFPYAGTSLHIFEPRYLELVENCWTLDRPFGIALIRSGTEVGDSAEPYLVGTSVRITSLRRNNDGTISIDIRGEWRFRIRQMDDALPYTVGFVERLEDQDDEIEPIQELATIAKSLFQAMFMQEFAPIIRGVHITYPDSATALSFMLSDLLDMPPLEKQRLLELTSSEERLSALIGYLQARVDANSDRMYRPLSGQELNDWVSPN